MPRIAVVGSTNIDLTLRVPRLPPFLGLKAVPFAHAPSSTQGFAGRGDGFAVLAFRGSERPRQSPRDWLTDFDKVKADVASVIPQRSRPRKTRSQSPTEAPPQNRVPRCCNRFAWCCRS